MSQFLPLRPIAIACGGTGGHLFPGLAVGHELLARGCRVTLLVSPKEVDQQAVRRIQGMEIMTLPAVALKRGGELSFLRGCCRSYRAAQRLFQSRRPQAVLAMGGFTSAPPIVAGKRQGARTFLHESNTIPGRANRLLAWLVNRAFVGFPTAADRLRSHCVTATGTPVRPQFRLRDAGECRVALGLDPERPVVAVIGGSQGASGINNLVVQSLPLLARSAPLIQWFHLTGPNNTERIEQAYKDVGLTAVIAPFFDEMDLVLGAASAAISRAGASSLAELAAMQVPALLVPYPAATDDHQLYNARAFVETGAARLLIQDQATAEVLVESLMDLVESAAVRETMQKALARWHSPGAAAKIAEAILEAVTECESGTEAAINRAQATATR
jgi:UDP-N-acetylglucosamine--N-acetylmuramyl-(pentapeptide) pyrophosphoryl-undecaprenol N-acetylglucosamine transferase